MRIVFLRFATAPQNYIEDPTMQSKPRPQLTLRQCPSPSRAFTGREDVLRQMELYFSDGKRTQHIFVLYGLGGGGKSQTAYKFVDQNQFETEPSGCVVIPLLESEPHDTTDNCRLCSFF